MLGLPRRQGARCRSAKPSTIIQLPRVSPGIVIVMRVLVILLAGQAMAVLDASILAVAAPSLRADLAATDAELQLVRAMYTIASAALVVTGARLSDVLAHRRAFLIGLAGFILASLAGRLASTPATLIAARAVQGAPGAVMTPHVLSIIQLQYEGEERVRAIGTHSVIVACGMAGEMIGGLVVGADLFTAAWRPALLINAPVGEALLVAARRGLPETGRGAPSGSTSVARLC